MTVSLSTARPLVSLEAEDVAYANHVALRKISLSVYEGEKVAVIGPSGAGKTTLLKRLYQLHPQQCAFVHQQHVLVSQLSVFHNIYMGRLDRNSLWKNLRNLVKPASAALEEIGKIADDLGLREKLFIRVGELSGGQKQRVGIGRALYQGGSVLLADEPVSSLDVVQREEVMAQMLGTGRTLITALHSIGLLKSCFQRIVGLKEGEILFDLPVESLTDKHIERLYKKAG